MAQHRLTLGNRKLAEVGRRLAWLRTRRGLTQQQLAERCSSLRDRLFPAKELPEVPGIRRDRIAKIELAASASVKSGARCLWAHELRLLATALGVSGNWLTGTSAGTMLRWNVWSQSQKAQEIADLIAFHEESSSTRWAWSVPLPCTLTPPVFTQHYYPVQIAAHGALLSGASSSEVVTALTSVAAANRERTLRRLEEGTLKFAVVMPLATLQSMVQGTGLYSQVRREVRSECLKWMISSLLRFSKHLKLAFATAEDLEPYRSWISSYQSWYVSGQLTAFHTSDEVTYLTEDASAVSWARQIIEQLYRSASFSTPTQVLRLLRSSLASLRGQAIGVRSSLRGNRRGRARQKRSQQRRLRRTA